MPIMVSVKAYTVFDLEVYTTVLCFFHIAVIGCLNVDGYL